VRAILIHIELAADGAISRASLELASLARTLAAQTGSAIHAFVIGHGTAEPARSAAAAAAASIMYVADSPKLAPYRPEPYRDAICAAIKASSAEIVLFAATATSRDVAPRIAARTGAMLATDCTAVELDGCNIRVKRQQYSGKFTGEFLLPGVQGTVRITTIRPNSFAPLKPAGSDANVDLVPLEVAFCESSTQRSAVLDVFRLSAEDGPRDVTEADIIVTGGRSLKSMDNFAIIEDLAEAIGGTVGATRAAVDAGYQPSARQIGLTGKTVAPRLYVACGVHGAIQHLAGMRSSRVIVAINTKRDAPIFDIATYGCIGDLFQIVPAITNELRERSVGDTVAR
jgi:electron transfer flavoprotein alpha subunit